ncbi:MAG: DUF4293 family protein [Flavobacteriales bacterium]|nr:DUF4293 family protein [Flavobacteriales bacterium]
MWQRRQTLYLALSILLLALMALLPLASYHTAQGVDAELRLSGVVDPAGVPFQDMPLRVPIPWLVLLLGGVLLVAILLYRNRPRQLRVVRSAHLLTFGITAALFFAHNAIGSYLGTVSTVERSLKPAIFIPFAVLLLCWLAERGIRKDEELVRSADRLR